MAPHAQNDHRFDIIIPLVLFPGWVEAWERGCYTTGSHLAEIDIKDPEDDGERELGRVDGEKPLGGVHVRLHPT